MITVGNEQRDPAMRQRDSAVGFSNEIQQRDPVTRSNSKTELVTGLTWRTKSFWIKIQFKFYVKAVTLSQLNLLKSFQSIWIKIEFAREIISLLCNDIDHKAILKRFSWSDSCRMKIFCWREILFKQFLAKNFLSKFSCRSKFCWRLTGDSLDRSTAVKPFKTLVHCPFRIWNWRL